MIQLFFGDRVYEYPNSWEELSVDQYLALIPLVNRMWAGEISMGELRVEWFKEIAGLNGVRVPARCRDRFADNIITASRQFNFFFKLDYGGKTNDLSFANRRLLEKVPADEIASSDGEIRYARSLEYSYKLDTVWAKNLIPTIDIEGQILQGWTADVSSGIMSSTLTAIQFTQGYDLLSVITLSPTHRAIALLVALLYGVDTNEENMVAKIEQLPQIVLQGVVLNFQALVSYIFSSAHYSILWDSNGDDGVKSKGAIRSAFSDSLYSLCKTGYGSYNQIEKMPLLTYLGIMRSDLISSVRSMAASGSSADEIAQNTNLPIGLILKML